MVEVDSFTITGGSPKNILLLVQLNQILGRVRQDVYVGSSSQ